MSETIKTLALTSALFIAAGRGIASVSVARRAVVMTGRRHILAKQVLLDFPQLPRGSDVPNSLRRKRAASMSSAGIHHLDAPLAF